MVQLILRCGTLSQAIMKCRDVQKTNLARSDLLSSGALQTIDHQFIMVLGSRAVLIQMQRTATLYGLELVYP